MVRLNSKAMAFLRISRMTGLKAGSSLRPSSSWGGEGASQIRNQAQPRSTTYLHSPHFFCYLHPNRPTVRGRGEEAAVDRTEAAGGAGHRGRRHHRRHRDPAIPSFPFSSDEHRSSIITYLFTFILFDQFFL